MLHTGDTRTVGIAAKFQLARQNRTAISRRKPDFGRAGGLIPGAFIFRRFSLLLDHNSQRILPALLHSTQYLPEGESPTIVYHMDVTDDSFRGTVRRFTIFIASQFACCTH